MRRIESRLDGVAGELGASKDELMVLSGIVLRLERRIAALAKNVEQQCPLN